MELSATAKVILGCWRWGRGPAMRSRASSTTRPATSGPRATGRSIPELRRLAEAGLIEGTDSPTGGRQRTIFELTKAGRAALRRVAPQPAGGTSSYRDEGMLKLFFAGAVAPERARRASRASAPSRPPRWPTSCARSRRRGGQGPGLLRGAPLRDRLQRHSSPTGSSGRRWPSRRASARQAPGSRQQEEADVQRARVPGPAPRQARRGRRRSSSSPSPARVGGSVADRLDPYGADDPDTEASSADERLEDAGYRDASVIVLMRGNRPGDPGRGQARSRRSSARSRPTPRSRRSPATCRRRARTSSPRTATPPTWPSA